MRRQKAAGKPCFLYLPFSMGHIPNLPSREFTGKSRIGNYGDKLMEGDYHVGQILDALKELGVDDNSLLVFASDNGPSGEAFREYGNEGTPDMGSPGPFRGELGEATEGSIRTFCFIRWPGNVKAKHNFIRHVLDDGFLSNLHQHHRGRAVQRPSY
jgi:arylsulfatase A-like enzyme